MGDFSTVTWDEENSENGANVENGSHEEENFDTIEAGPSSRKDDGMLAGDDIYFEFLVSDPQKEQEGSQNAYISYLLTTKTNSPSFQSSVTKIRRRFSDFVYLYNRLSNDYLACAVPPLPDKSKLEYLKGDRFGPEFTLKRASSLTRFLTRIGNHPTLKRSRLFYSFLESSDWNSLKTHKGSLSQSSNELSGNSGVFEGISDTLLNAFSKAQTQSKELLEVKEKCDKFDENLAVIEKHFSRVVRRQGDLVTDLEDFANQVVKLTALEPSLSKDFGEFAKGNEDLLKGFQTLKEQTENDYIVSLKDMENYVGALKGVIKQREQKQLDYEGLTEYLERAKSDLSVLKSGGGTNFIRNKVEDFRGVDHDYARNERIRKLEQKIEDLGREVVDARDTSEKFEQVALDEVAIFERNKSQEMKGTLIGLADNHIAFYERVINDWEKVYKSFDVDN